MEGKEVMEGVGRGRIMKILPTFTFLFGCSVIYKYFIHRSDIYVEAETRVGTVNATSGVFVAARIDKGGCSAFAAEGIYFFLFPAEGTLLVTGDLGIFFLERGC